MNTQNSLPHPPSSSLFQGDYYTRRRSLPERQNKPTISKVPGKQKWLCRTRYPVTKRINGAIGVGSTPALAYADWYFRTQTR